MQGHSLLTVKFRDDGLCKHLQSREVGRSSKSCDIASVGRCSWAFSRVALSLKREESAVCSSVGTNSMRERMEGYSNLSEKVGCGNCFTRTVRRGVVEGLE